jgi:hypothetical protein
MLVTKSNQPRFPMKLAALPSFTRTQAEFVLFNFDLHCPISDNRNSAPHVGTTKGR